MAEFEASHMSVEGRCQFERIQSETLLYIFSYLSSVDSTAVNLVSRRFLYFSEKLGSIQPSLATASSTAFQPKEAMSSALQELSVGKPNVAFCFYSEQSPSPNWLAEATALLPDDCALLAAASNTVQVNLDFHDKLSVMLGSFPGARPLCFNFEPQDKDDDESMKSQQEEEEALTAGIMGDFDKEIPPGGDYKVFVVYSVGEGTRFTEAVIERIQQEYPNAAIIGGICGEGDIVRNNAESAAVYEAKGKALSIKDLKKALRDQKPRVSFSGLEKTDLVTMYAEIMRMKARYVHITDGIFGMAIGGTCPLRSIVSRGVRSITTGEVALATGEGSTGTATKCAKIGDVVRGDATAATAAALAAAEADAGLDELIDPRAFDNGITEGTVGIRNLIIPDGKNGTTVNTTEYIYSTLRAGKKPEFFGVRNNPETGFALHQLTRGMLGEEHVLLEEEGQGQGQGMIEAGDDVDLFSLDPEACMTDLTYTLVNLKSHLQKEKLLGALMFSCGARGPQPRMLPIAMADATSFCKLFPHVPLQGFYAGGEIGPEARAANGRVYMQGRVKLQGFTVVFGVFIVPRVHLRDYHLTAAEDVPEKYKKYAQDKIRAREAR